MVERTCEGIIMEACVPLFRWNRIDYTGCAGRSAVFFFLLLRRVIVLMDPVQEAWSAETWSGGGDICKVELMGVRGKMLLKSDSDLND